MIDFHGQTITEEEYMKMQKKLFDDMAERSKQKTENNASVLAETQKRGSRNPMLSIEESKYLLAKIALFSLEKIGRVSGEKA